MVYHFLYAFCTFSACQCICCRVRSKPSVLWGLKKKKIHFVTAPSLYRFVIYTQLILGEKSPHSCACVWQWFLPRCWESNLTKIWYTQQHITKGFTVKTFIAKWSLKTRKAKESSHQNEMYDTNLDFWIHCGLCAGISNSNYEIGNWSSYHTWVKCSSIQTRYKIFGIRFAQNNIVIE